MSYADHTESPTPEEFLSDLWWHAYHVMRYANWIDKLCNDPETDAEATAFLAASKAAREACKIMGHIEAELEEA